MSNDGMTQLEWGAPVTGRTVSMRFGGVDVLVETIPVAGSEPTSKLDDAADRVVDALDRAKAVIVGIASSTAEVVGRMGSAAATPPNKVEVEFGIGFSVKGNVIVAGGQADATLKVKLTYDVVPAE